MFKFLTVDNLIGFTSTVFWGVFYAWTAVSLFATLYAGFERMVVSDRFSGVDIKYTGTNFSKGVVVGAVGIAGILVGWVLIPLVVAGVPAFPAPSRLFAGAGSGEKIGLVIAILSAITFNIGVWLGLTSEEWSQT